MKLGKNGDEPKPTEPERDWPFWMNLLVWGTLLIVTVLDIQGRWPLTPVWMLRYGTLVVGIGTNFLPGKSRLKWLLGGIALALLAGSLVLGLH